MFRAVNRLTNESVVIIDSDRWNKQTIEPLRVQAREGEMLCPTCGSPVLVKAGNIKIWHFAHQAVKDCPFHQESPRRLMMRLVSYRWLSSIFPGQVEIETRVDGVESECPLDIVIRTEHSRPICYWMLDRGIRSVEKRDAMWRVLNGELVCAHVLFDAEMINRANGQAGMIRLRTTEREFTSRSRFDAIYGRARSLFYLDTEMESMTINRDVISGGPCVTDYETVLHAPLCKVQVCDQTGEFFLKEELDRLEHYKAEREKRREIERDLASLSPRYRQSRNTVKTQHQSTRQTLPMPDFQSQDRKAVCTICGKDTPEHDQIIYKAGKCQCRDCLGMRRPN